MIRAIESHDGPFAGVLVTRGDAVAVRVDAAELAGWDGWRFGGSEHVVGPLDIVRRAQGHDALLPWCTERLSTFVGRRTAMSEGLSSGECSTLLVSLFRALEELGRVAAVVDASGTWWLTDDGRPVFVLGEGEEARTGVAVLVAQLGESCADKTLGRLLDVVQEGLRTNLEQQQRRVPPLLLEKWEGGVLEVAAPRALRRDAFAPESAAMAARAALQWESSPPVSRRAGNAARGEHRQRRTAGERARRRSPDMRLAELLAGAFRWARGRARSPRVPVGSARTERSAAPRRDALRSRRRSLLVATGAAIAVLLTGLLWPSEVTSGAADGADKPADSVDWSQTSDPDQEGAADPPSAAGSRGATADAQPSTEPSPPGAQSSAPEAESPADAAFWLLEEIERCADTGDAVCASAVADGSTAVIGSLADGATEYSDVEIVDEYGDAAVVRATQAETGHPDSTDTGESGVGRMLVLVRVDEKWLVRDVYDVADQPE